MTQNILLHLWYRISFLKVQYLKSMVLFIHLWELIQRTQHLYSHYSEVKAQQIWDMKLNFIDRSVIQDFDIDRKGCWKN